MSSQIILFIYYLDFVLLSNFIDMVKKLTYNFHNNNQNILIAIFKIFSKKMLGVILDKMLRFNLLFLAGIERLVQRKSYLVTSKHSVFQKWQSSINNFFKCKREKVIENQKR